MKNCKIPNFLVSAEEFADLQSHISRLFKTKLTKQALQSLPRAIEANEFMLIFPVQLCPKTIVFRTRDKQTCVRDILNVVATKEEDGSEILKFRLK